MANVAKAAFEPYFTPVRAIGYFSLVRQNSESGSWFGQGRVLLFVNVALSAAFPSARSSPRIKVASFGFHCRKTGTACLLGFTLMRNLPLSKDDPLRREQLTLFSACTEACASHRDKDIVS